MKKLLLILMITPLLFISCNKDDDTPDNNNNNNNNNGTSTFLENQDGTVWIAETFDENTFFQGAVHSDQKIGFYNAINFIYQKDIHSNGTEGHCQVYYEGSISIDFGGLPVDLSILTNSSNELLLRMTMDDVLDPSSEFFCELKFTSYEGSNQMNLQETAHYPIGYGQWMDHIKTVTYIKSTTETNLSCN